MPKPASSVPEGAVAVGFAKKRPIGSIISDFMEISDPVMIWDESDIKQYGKKEPDKPEEVYFATRMNILIGAIRRSIDSKVSKGDLEQGALRILENRERKEIYLQKV